MDTEWLNYNLLEILLGAIFGLSLLFSSHSLHQSESPLWMLLLSISHGVNWFIYFVPFFFFCLCVFIRSADEKQHREISETQLSRVCRCHEFCTNASIRLPFIVSICELFISLWALKQQKKTRKEIWVSLRMGGKNWLLPGPRIMHCWYTVVFFFCFVLLQQTLLAKSSLIKSYVNKNQIQVYLKAYTDIQKNVKPTWTDESGVNPRLPVVHKSHENNNTDSVLDRMFQILERLDT